MGIVYSKMFERLLSVICIAWFGIILTQSDTQAKTKPQPINPPELILFSEKQPSEKLPSEKLQSVTYKIGEKDKAVAALLESDQSRPVFVYVHGRALGQTGNHYDKEPKKSEEKVIPEIFSRYQAYKVLMFHWPHWGNFNDYKEPAKDAESAGPAFAELLAEIDKAVKIKKPNCPLMLITHSMGSIVLGKALGSSQPSDLSNFHTVAIFSAASRYDQSWIWLSKIKSGRSYVFSNNRDPVLSHVNDALGKCGETCLSNKKRADGVVYIDLSPLRLEEHQYFVFGKQPEGVKRKLAEDVIKPILTVTAGEPKFDGTSVVNIKVVRP